MALSLSPINSLQDDLFDSLPVIRRIVNGFSRSYEPVGIGGVFARQGCGRTSMLAMCEEFAAKNPLQIDHKITCWIKPFQASKLVAIGSPFNALLWHIQRNLPENVLNDEKILYKLGRISVALSALESAADYGTGTVDSSRNLELINNSLPPERKSRVSSIFSACEYIEELAESFSSLGKLICERCGFDVIIIPIDDLDKCIPSKAISLLAMAKTIVQCKYFSFLIGADRGILARFLNSYYDNILTYEQSDDLLMTYFDDWVNLPTPPLRNVLKKIDFPLSIKEQFNSQAEAAGITDFASSLNSVHRACRRFEAFIYGGSVKSTNSISDYISWLGWFLIGTDDIQSIEIIAKSNNMEGMIKKIRDPLPASSEKKTPASTEQGNRIRFDSKPADKPKNHPSIKDESDSVIPVKRYLECMRDIITDKELTMRLREVLPYL